ADARTLTISDNGIGLSRDEAIEHLGTIARSGTREFFGKLSGDQARDAQLIGQFGVGFYSAFIVADRVTVVYRRAGLAAGDGVRWQSEGCGEYAVEPVEKAGRGTDVWRHLRGTDAAPAEGGEAGEAGDAAAFDDLLVPWTIKSVVR